ncbi:hypothetical protein IWQ57_005366, partial [Coemansia nantahalensis]
MGDTEDREKFRSPPTNADHEVLKIPLLTVWHHAESLPRLEEHVTQQHFLGKHARQFARHVLLRLMMRNDFDVSDHINETFFSELIQHLTTRNEREAKPRTMRMRALIAPHVPGYMALARLQPIDVRYPGGPAMYDAIKMETEYNNNVSLRYGDLLRVAAEQLLIARELELHPELRVEGRSQSATNRAIRPRVKAAATRAKAAVVLGRPGVRGLDPATRRALRPLDAVFRTYKPRQQFEDGDLESDSHLHPEKHFRAFWVLARVIAQAGGKVRQVFPQRRSFIPAHCKIDTRILCDNILQTRRVPAKDFLEAWSRVVDTDHRAFQPARTADPAVQRKFCGSVETDGVSLCILKMTDAAKKSQRVYHPVEGEAKPKKHHRRKRKRPRRGGDGDDGSDETPRPPAEFRYVDDLDADTLQRMKRKKNTLVLDPGCTRQLHGVHESSTPERPDVYSLSRLEIDRRRHTGRHHKVLRKVKRHYPGGDVRAAEHRLSLVSGKPLDIAGSDQHIMAMAREWTLLSRFYTTTETVHANSRHQWHQRREEALRRNQDALQRNQDALRATRTAWMLTTRRSSRLPTT